MDRRFRWELLEYTHTERSCSFDSYVWANEPDLREEVRNATGLTNLLEACETEWDQILAMMNWVHNLSAHQGWDEAPSLGALELLNGARQGEVTFRCVEFAHMLQHVYSAYGVPSRVIGVRRPNSATGLGKGHVVVDAWSNELQKWVLLDPQMDMFYADRSGAPLSLFELHDRVRQGNFADIVMSREPEMESGFTGTTAQDNSDYDSIEVPEGFDRDEVWASLPEHGDFRGFAQFWEEYYHHFTVRRLHSYKRDPSMTGSSDGNGLFYYQSSELPPIVFQRMSQTFEYTSDRTKIDFPVNGVEVQWVHSDLTEHSPLEETRKVTLHFKHSMPWFHHYDVTVNDESSTRTEHNLSVSLRSGENLISVTPCNDLGRHGKTSVVRLLVN